MMEMVDMPEFEVLFRRADGSFVISRDGMPCHVALDDPLYADVLSAWQPAPGEAERPVAPGFEVQFRRLDGTFVISLDGLPYHVTPDDPLFAAVAEAGQDAPFEAEPDFPVPPVSPKLAGIEFEGVMCSATKDDQTGLMAVLLAIQLQGPSFPPTRFEFENGNTLVITLANYQAFMAVWLPFRQSFFVVTEAQ